MLESAVEKKLKKKIEKLGGLCLKFHPESKSGMPDRLVILPGGQMYWVELKKPGEKARPLQLKRKKQLEALGCKCFIVDSPESLNAFIKEVSDEIRSSRISKTSN